MPKVPLSSDDTVRFQIGEDMLLPVYNVGFSENVHENTFLLPAEALANGKDEVHLTVDQAKLFDTAGQSDMLAPPSVKFNRTDAEMLAKYVTQTGMPCDPGTAAFDFSAVARVI